MTDFPGKIARTVAESTPWWPEPQAAQTMPPNVVTIVFDDTGWADFGCFGSEIRTPNIDALAARGLRFTNFHVTPLCSPTRASFLTGRNHHAVGMRCLADSDTGFPNSRGAIAPDVPLLPQLMRAAGYGTYMVGKWHLTPAHEITPSGPYGNWPLSRGFDRFYGFLGGCTDQYTPELICDNQTIVPPSRAGYHLSEDLCDRAIGYLRDHSTFRRTAPFFLDLSFGATHAPFQVDRRYVDPYVAVFEKGWDRTRADRLARQKALGLVPEGTRLVPRNPSVPAWADLDADQRTVYTRLQATFAGFLEHADEQIGRLIAELRRLHLFDNTIVLVFSDNGASREGRRDGAVNCNGVYGGHPESVASMVGRIETAGGPDSPVHYPEGWAMAGNTPFRRYKQYVELGGIRSPMVVSWPMGIEAAGEVRTQFLHAVDLAPTIMDLTGNRRAATFDGKSFREVLATSESPSPRSVQYWEMFGRRAILVDGWKAVSEHEKGDDYAEDVWRLYDTRADFSEHTDLAARFPDKLAELKDAWWQEAEANGVMPLDDRTLVDIIAFRQPNGLMSQREITLWPGQSHISQPSMITSTERSMTVTAHFVDTLGTAEGVLISSGDDLGGYVLYVKDGELVLEYVSLGRRHRLSARIAGETRRCGFRWAVATDRGVVATLEADGDPVATGAMGSSTHHLSFWGIDVGSDRLRTVSDAYRTPFAFPENSLDRLVIRFADDPISEAVAALTAGTE